MDLKKKIYIFDDERDGKVLQRALARFETRIASDLGVGCSEVEQWNPDLIVVDLTSPLRQGFTFLEQKAVDPVLSRIPAIVAVDEKDEIRQLRGLALGAVAYIVKPWLERDVLLQTERLLKDPSFKVFRSPKSVSTQAFVKIPALIRLVGEFAMVIEGPIKLTEGHKVEIEGPMIENLGLSGEVMRSSRRASFPVGTGVFSSEVNLVGLDEQKTSKIRRLTQLWGRKHWNRLS